MVVRTLTIIAATYHQLFEGTLSELLDKELPGKFIIPRTAFTYEAYARLRDSISSSIKASSTSTQQDRTHTTSKQE